MHLIRDEDLIPAVARGDASAFSELVRRHQAWAWSIAYRYLGNREDAEDLVQEAFLRLLQAAPRYRPTAAFRTYFSRIVSRLCLDCVRKKRPLSAVDLPEVEDSAPVADDALIAQEQVWVVRRAIRQLPPQQRLAVILRYYEGYGYREIAVALVITEKAAERLLARGRERLGRILREPGGGF